MKSVLIFVAAITLFVSSCQQAEEQNLKPAEKKEITKADLKTEDDNISYSLGFSMGSRFVRDGLGINLEIFQEGMKDGFTGSKQILNEEGIKRFCQLVGRNIEALSKKQWEVLNRMLRLKVIISSQDLINVNVALPPVRDDTEIELTRLSSLALLPIDNR